MENEFIFIFILLFTIVSVYSITPVRYMAIYSYKSMTLVVNDSILLELTGDRLNEQQSSYRHYAINIATHEKQKLILHFISMDIALEADTPDRLHVFDYTAGGPLQVSPPSGLFGVYDYYFHHENVGLHDYMSTRNKFRLDYMGKPTLLYSGFKILITSYEDVDANSQCKRNYFRCAEKDICIPVSVRCDGFRNCGEADASDEHQCDHEISTNLEDGTQTAVLATSLSAGSFILVVVIVIWAIRRQLQKRDKELRKMDYGKRMRYQASCKDAPPCYEEVIREPPPNYDTATSNHNPDRSEIISFDIESGMLESARQNSFITSALVSCAIDRDESQHDSAFQDESSSEIDELTDMKEQGNAATHHNTESDGTDGDLEINNIEGTELMPEESRETVGALQSKREDIRKRYQSYRTPSSRSGIEYIDAPGFSPTTNSMSLGDIVVNDKLESENAQEDEESPSSLNPSVIANAMPESDSFKEDDKKPSSLNPSKLECISSASPDKGDLSSGEVVTMDTPILDNSKEEEESVGPLKPSKSEIRRTYQAKQTPSSRSDIEYIDK